jgi:hypothetical protein
LWLRVVTECLRFRRESSLTNDVNPFALAEQEGQLVSRERLIIDDYRSERHAFTSEAVIQLPSSPEIIRGTCRRSSTVRAPVNSITERSS